MPDTIPGNPIFVRALHPGMGQAVAERTVLRRQPDGSFETWGDVAHRVALGNTMLVPGDTPAGVMANSHEYTLMRKHIAKASLLMSGRHLQHGDETQPTRNLEVFSNCFHRGTTILTLEYGSVALESVVGQTVTVKARDGQWRKAQVRSYGHQKLYRYKFTARTGPVGNAPLEAIATANHRWFLRDGRVTENLQIGDFIAPAPFIDGEDLEAVRHGLIFGDGTSHKRRDDFHAGRVCQGRDYVGIRLCGADKKYLDLFEGYPVTYPLSAGGDPFVYLGRKQFWKEVPFCTDPAYIAGFIKGWWLADGAKGYGDADLDRIEIATANAEAAEWLKTHAPYAGYTLSGCDVKDRKEDSGCYANGKPLHVIRLSRGKVKRVVSIEEFGEDEVFCVEEPVTTGFVLGNGLLTGNCSTAAMSWVSFTLLLNGSGVGRCYDDDFIVTNWDHAPNLRVVLDANHADFAWGVDEDIRDARHKYRGENVVFHEVADSREGWGKAIEIWETMTYQKVYRDHTLVLDFSKVRPRGAPIKGMQGRPSSGPKPLMAALMKCASIKGAGMPPWMQAMYVDHYQAECVLVGGARRAARMSTKTWRDRGVLEFIRVKRPTEYDGKTMDEVISYRADLAANKIQKPYAFLWSSNNSVTVDQEFWDCVNRARTAEQKGTLASQPRIVRHAWSVINALTEAAYGDGTGEPGVINVDKLVQNDAGMTNLTLGDFVGSLKYQVEDETRLVLARLAKLAAKRPYSMIVNPCSEIPLIVLGAYCVIADAVPFHADTLAEAEEVFRVATRALMRVNLMNNLYAAETTRTNRIGVGMTGVHEFAWKFFQVGFRDLINPDFSLPLSDADIELWVIHGGDLTPRQRAAAFWLTLARFSRTVQDESVRYAAELGVAVPHTCTTMKPAGTTSKLFGLTEGYHLPALTWYLRWVQFRHDDPLIETYKAAGYPTRELKSYSGTVIVGFPTEPAIAGLGMGKHLVTASEATPEEQYEWLKLGEKFWIKGTDGQGVPLHAEGEDRGGQISYTLKYDPTVVSYAEFFDMLVKHQGEIRCCSVMPTEADGAYEYLPEEAVSKADYEGMMRAIKSAVAEDIGFEHVDCGTGGCPVDFGEGEKMQMMETSGSTDSDWLVITSSAYPDCPSCEQIKALLTSRGMAFNLLDAMGDGRVLMLEYGLKTVPQMFYRGRYVGRFEDTQALIEAAEILSQG